MVKVRKKRQKNFTILDNTVLHDTELTLKAKGLFAYLWSQSDEWNFYETEVVKHSKDGISSLRSGIHELEERGYLQRQRVRVKGKLKDSMWILSETPNLENLSLENLNLENDTLINTNLNNTNNNNRSVDKSTDQDRRVKGNSPGDEGDCAIKEHNNISNNDQSDSKKVSEKQLDEDFNKLWKLYPRKEGKKKAFEAYKRAIKQGVTNKEIQTGIVNYLKQIKIQGTDKKYIKQGSTWFNGNCWDDEYSIGSNNSPVNPQKSTAYAAADERKDRAEGFMRNLREHPEWFTEDHIKEFLEDFPEMESEVKEIERARRASDSDTTK